MQPLCRKIDKFVDKRGEFSVNLALKMPRIDILYLNTIKFIGLIVIFLCCLNTTQEELDETGKIWYGAQIFY